MRGDGVADYNSRSAYVRRLRQLKVAFFECQLLSLILRGDSRCVPTKSGGTFLLRFLNFDLGPIFCCRHLWFYGHQLPLQAARNEAHLETREKSCAQTRWKSIVSQPGTGAPQAEPRGLRRGATSRGLCWFTRLAWRIKYASINRPTLKRNLCFFLGRQGHWC